ncbi:asparaginase [Streptomyces sp. MP131-18]|uniref:asparaginase n=1 Tax=Streptomyces sp. MP131-18 TaxID=1857892 RepID=UPI00097C2B61|nr:asparaginase [Streptomyces sp. MP131-18]ONK13453.1 L-asparaginase II [Streptomyces sp. MP131-18]
MSSIPPVAPVLAEVVRSGFVEGRHRGALVVLAADGSVERALGDVTGPVFPRSSNKPLQAAAVLRSGLGLAGERLALAAASHAGEDAHRRLAARLLAEAGLGEEALRCPPDRPLGGGEPSRSAMNCSGKHAAMLAASAANGWPVETYTDPDHPLQLLARETIEAATGETVAHVGVDGCGAPLFAFSLTGLARAFRGCVLAAPDSPERRVADAMRAHPWYVAGTGRPDTLLMAAVPGLLAKGGAEGVQAVALPDGRALAFKIEDGAARALGPVLAALLTTLGVDASAVPPEPVTGGGRPVGEVRATV